MSQTDLKIKLIILISILYEKMNDWIRVIPLGHGLTNLK